MSLVQRLWRRAAYDRAIRRGDHRFLEASHTEFWRAGNADGWYDRTGHRFEGWFLARHEPFVEALTRAVGTEAGFSQLLEIGTGNGRVLEFLAGRLGPRLEATGIDLNAARIRRNRHEIEDPGLRFVCADAASFVREEARPGTVFLTNAGVFEYFSPETLSGLVNDVAERLDPSVFALIEPLAPDMDLERELDSRAFGQERSFSHNYPHLLSAAGFRIRHQRELQIQGHRILELVALRGS